MMSSSKISHISKGCRAGSTARRASATTVLSVLTRFVADKNPKWLDLIFNEEDTRAQEAGYREFDEPGDMISQGELIEGYARTVKAAGLMDMLVSSIAERAGSILDDTEEDTDVLVCLWGEMDEVIVGILDAEPNEADKERLQELRTRERRF